MATTIKNLGRDDVATSKTLLHEAIPLTGTIVSGTYSDNNIKNYSHGMFQSVYDYPYLSSSANHIFDITVGYSANSHLSKSTSAQNSKKINIYNQMAQVLVGHDVTGSIREFDRDGNTSDTGTKIREAIFINFSRLLVKDEIKKNSFKLKFLTGSSPRTPNDFSSNGAAVLTIQGYDETNTYKTNSPAGEYALLYTGSAESTKGQPCGLLYYQAGLAVLTASVFSGPKIDGYPAVIDADFGPPEGLPESGSVDRVLSGSNISSSADSIRARLYDCTYNNVTELNSTIYFCRVNHNDFNYSSNPTYLSSSTIRVKNVATDSPVSYITTVGLYDTNDNCLAVAKLSEPLKKTPSNEVTLRVRLDY